MFFSYKKNFIFYSNSLIKLLLMLFYIFLSYFYNHPIYLILFFINLTVITCFARSLNKAISFMKMTFYLAFFILLINTILNNEGSTILAIIPLNIPLIGNIYITVEVIIYSLISILQLLLIIYAFALISILIDPDELMKTFLKLKMPYLMTFLVTSSLRFFPLILKDLNQITDVQRSRGFELDKGNIFTRIKNRIILILPLLANSLERSIQVSEALETRAFGLSEKRTYYKHLSLSKLDCLMIILISLFFGVLIYFKLLGYGYYQIFPRYGVIELSHVDFFLISFIIISNLIFVLLLKIRSKMI
ncbi:MAG: energy-coupling factor transporter transmembrane component T family protein [Candidatus Helarchaeota archaeon]